MRTVEPFQPTQRSLFREVAKARKKEQENSVPVSMKAQLLVDHHGKKRKLEVNEKIEDKKISNTQPSKISKIS